MISMGRTQLARTTLVELKKRISEAQKYKKLVIKHLQDIKKNYDSGKITYSDYVERLHKHTDGRNLHELVDYYERYIQRCEKLIKKEKKKIIKKQISVFFIISMLIALVVISSFYFQPKFTGLITQRETFQNIDVKNITGPITETDTILSQITLGQPVKWRKHIEIKEQGIVKVRLPKDAEKIIVNKIEKPYSETKEVPSEDLSPSQREPLSSGITKNISSTTRITGAVISTSKQGFLTRFFKKLQGAITGKAIDSQLKQGTEIIINDTATKYEIEYETPAPYAIEEEKEKGKKITIVGPDDIHYKNVLAFTKLLKVIPPIGVPSFALIVESFITAPLPEGSSFKC